MPGFPENDLEVVLVSASTGNADIDELLDVLVRSSVWVPLTSVEGSSGSFPVLSIDGGSFVPAFTSESQLEHNTPGSARVNPPVSELVRSLPDSVGLAVNPGGEVGLPISAGILRQALALPVTLPSGTRLRVGEPAAEPVQLLDAVGAALGSVPSARSARRCWATVGDSRPGLVLGIDIDPDNDESRAAALAAVRAVTGTKLADFPVDVTFDNDRDEFTRWMRDNVQPFYSR